MNIRKLAEIGGYFGMISIQGAALPVILAVVTGWQELNMPLYYILLVAIGLFLFLLRSIAAKDLLYTISNSVGLLGQIGLILIAIK